MRPKLTSSASLFAQRGNPWNGDGRKVPATPRPPSDYIDKIEDIRAKHGLVSDTCEAEVRERNRPANATDPDFDQFFCKKAIPRVEHPSPQGMPTPLTHVRRVANVRQKHKPVRPINTGGSSLLRHVVDPSSEEAKITKLMADGLSREKATQAVRGNKQEKLEQMADYAAKMFGRG